MCPAVLGLIHDYQTTPEYPQMGQDDRILSNNGYLDHDSRYKEGRGICLGV